MASSAEEATNPLYDVDDDGDVVEDDEEEDEDEVEAKILQLQDQFQEVKQQRKEARLVSTAPTFGNQEGEWNVVRFFPLLLLFPPHTTTTARAAQT